MYRMKPRTYIYRSALAAVLMGGAAAASPDAAIAVASDVAVDPSQAAASTPVAIEEILVTAQRRSERLIDVPATVAVLSAQTLAAANVTNSMQLTQMTPGLQMTQQGTFAEPQIRGVGTPIVALGNSTNISIYLDGVYQMSQSGNNFDLSAIDNIQVLEGPQGTLYGRNATGGAILVNTKNPTFDPSGDISLSYGSFGERRGELYVTGGLGEKVAANLAIYGKADDGYLTNIYPTPHPVGANDTESVRGKILYEATPDLKFLLSADYTNRSDPMGNDSGAVDGNSRAKKYGLPVNTEDYQIALSYDPWVKYKSTGTTLTTDYELPFAHVTSHTAFRRTLTAYHSDGDYTTISLPSEGGVDLFVHASERQISQEVQLTSTHAGPLQWMVGGEYNNELSKYLSNLNRKQSVTANTFTTNWSGFAELTYNITDKLSVIGGARYSAEKKEMTTWGPGTLDPYDGARIDAQKTWPSTTPRGVIKYKFDDLTNVYVSYSKGFKSGGFNPSAPPSVQVPFNPEKITAFEVGVKTRAIHNLRLEASAFHYDYNDVQVQTSVTSPIPGEPTTNTYNAAQARLYGGEFSADWTPVERLNLDAGLSYTHGRYTSFPTATVTTPTPGLKGNITSIKNISGNHMLKVPALTANLSARYRQVMNSGFIEYTANAYYNSGWYGDLGNRLRQPAYAEVNTQISWSPANERFKIAFWVKNLTNTVYDIWLTDTPTTDRNILAQPRSFGGTISAKF